MKNTKKNGRRSAQKTRLAPVPKCAVDVDVVCSCGCDFVKELKRFSETQLPKFFDKIYQNIEFEKTVLDNA